MRRLTRTAQGSRQEGRKLGESGSGAVRRSRALGVELAGDDVFEGASPSVALHRPPTGRRDKTSVRLGVCHQGGPRPRGALITAMEPHAEEYDAGAIRHSVGQKMAGDAMLWECCNPDTPLASLRHVST